MEVLSMLGIAFGRTLLAQAPRIIDWLFELKEAGKTDIIDSDIQALEDKWDIPGAKFFE